MVLGATGCVRKNEFREHVGATDRRLTAAESSIEDKERKISDLRKDTDQKVAALESQTADARQRSDRAMNRAEEAIRGRLLWTVTLTDDQVKFPFGTSDLPADSAQVLDDLIDKVKSYGKALYVEIEGHTDDVGEARLNFELGEQRALAVRDYLSRTGGIPLHAMNTISLGETQPVADNGTKSGRAQNRRVVIRVLE
jgi:outer membrane protein OmpA-like peptidoglycan-associated protein